MSCLPATSAGHAPGGSTSPLGVNMYLVPAWRRLLGRSAFFREWEMLPLIMGLLNVVLGRADRWRDKSVEQRTRVAAFLYAVSDCLTRIATDLRADRVPHSACSELAHYALQLPE